MQRDAQRKKRRAFGKGWQAEPVASLNISSMTNPNKAGLALGGLIGGWHVFWALLVLLGWAQPLLDFIFWAHMLQSIYLVKVFDPRAALILVIITSFSGYVFGFIGAVLWNKLHRTQ